MTRTEDAAGAEARELGEAAIGKVLREKLARLGVVQNVVRPQ